MKNFGFCAVVSAAFLVGCASQPEEIAAAYVSPLQYKSYDCEQISMEAERVSQRTNELQSSLKKTADDDAVQMGVGLVLFWPALFFLEGGDDARAQEYARLKGEHEALKRESVEKKCNIQFDPAEVAEVGTPES